MCVCVCESRAWSTTWAAETIPLWWPSLVTEWTCLTGRWETRCSPLCSSPPSTTKHWPTSAQLTAGCCRYDTTAHPTWPHAALTNKKNSKGCVWNVNSSLSVTQERVISASSAAFRDPPPALLSKVINIPTITFPAPDCFKHKKKLQKMMQKKQNTTFLLYIYVFIERFGSVCVCVYRLYFMCSIHFACVVVRLAEIQVHYLRQLFPGAGPEGVVHRRRASSRPSSVCSRE